MLVPSYLHHAGNMGTLVSEGDSCVYGRRASREHTLMSFRELKPRDGSNQDTLCSQRPLFAVTTNNEHRVETE